MIKKFTTPKCNASLKARIPIASFLLVLSLGVSGMAQEGKIRLDFRKENFSADIEQASLRAVLAEIKEKSGIWHKTWLEGEASLNEKVSVRFSRLRIKDGLERILSDVNHSLVLEGSSVVGVMLFGKVDKRRPAPTTRRRPPVRRRR